MASSRMLALAGFLLTAAAAAPLSGCEGCDGGGVGPDALPPDAPAPGTLSLTWSLTDVNNQPITCDQVGAQSVTLSIRNINAVFGETAVFSCASGMGTTQSFAPGMYVVDFELVDVSSTLSTLPRRGGIVVESGRDTAIGAVTFSVNAVGGIETFLKATGTQSNCGAANQMGAAWTGVTISLFRAGNVCQPGTITIAAGASQPAGTYVVSCPTPTVAPCIEADQKLTAVNLPSGPYTIRVRGRNGATDCWINNDMIAVPPLARTLMGTLNLSKQALPGC